MEIGHCFLCLCLVAYVASEEEPSSGVCNADNCEEVETQEKKDTPQVS